jgi:hypothetical protein
MITNQIPNSSVSSIAKRENSDIINWGNLYKIYASVEVNTQQQKYRLEIIDGFLRGNEKIEFSAHQNVSDNISLVTLEISPSTKLNTYLKTEYWNYFHSNHKILVLVKKQNLVVGYQFVGMDGEIIPESQYKTLSKVL